MAQPTEKQIKDLEIAMTEQFYHLATAAAFRIGLARQFGLDGPVFLKYNNVYTGLVKKWINREVKYERELLKKGIYGIIASGDLKYNDFFSSAALSKLIALTRKWNAEKTTSGLGFIPLLVWAAIAIIGLFTAQEVVDDLTTTTQEKAELLKATQDTAKELGLTPEQASGLISQTQAEASKGSGIGDTIETVALWGVLGFLAFQVIKSQSTSKT